MPLCLGSQSSRIELRLGWNKCVFYYFLIIFPEMLLIKLIRKWREYSFFVTNHAASYDDFTEIFQKNETKGFYYNQSIESMQYWKSHCLMEKK